MAAVAAQSTPAPAAGQLDAQALGERILPALASRKKACITLLARDNCTLGEVVDNIVADPGLTIAVLQEVNRKRGQDRVRIASVDSAANLLGQTLLKACLRKVPELEAVCQSENLPMALMLWERQRHASAQAAHWAQLREDKAPSECQIVAMCAGLPELMACIYHPDIYRAVLAIQNERGTQGAGATLGLDFADLGRRLVRQWCLPELLDDVFCAERHEFYRPLGITLASELARQVDAGWYTARTVTCLEVIADYLGLPYDRCVEMVHQVAVRCARSGTLPGAVPAAARLVQQPGEVAITGVTADQGKAPAKATVDDRQARVQGLLLHFKQKIRGADLRDVLTLMMSVLHKRLKFSRCAFFILNKEKTSLQARIALGENVDVLQQLQLDVRESRVLRSLLNKPQSLMVNAQNIQRYAPHLPQAFNQASEESFACTSLFVGGKPLGVMYVDRQSAKDFGAERYDWFKTLCGLANQSLRGSGEPAKTNAPAESHAA